MQKWRHSGTRFQEFNIGPDCLIDRTYQEENSEVPDVEEMFIYVCSSQQLEVLRFLCAKFPEDGFYGALKTTIDSGNTEMLRFICNRCPELAKCDMGEEQCFLVLGYAASRGENELVKVLLEAGADPSLPPPYKWPAC